MIENRRADAEGAGSVSRIGAGLDDLVDEARKTGAFRVGRRCAGVDLKFALPSEFAKLEP